MIIALVICTFRSPWTPSKRKYTLPFTISHGRVSLTNLRLHFHCKQPYSILKKVLPSLTDKTFAKMCCTIQSGTTAISSESGSALGLFCQMFVREVEQQKSDWQKQSSCKTFLPILSVSFQKLFTAILFSPLVYLFIRHSTELRSFTYPASFQFPSRPKGQESFFSQNLCMT